MKLSRVGVYLAKNVFQLHGVDRTGQSVWRRRLRRDQWNALTALVRNHDDKLAGLCRFGQHRHMDFQQVSHVRVIFTSDDFITGSDNRLFRFLATRTVVFLPGNLPSTGFGNFPA